MNHKRRVIGFTFILTGLLYVIFPIDFEFTESTVFNGFGAFVAFLHLVNEMLKNQIIAITAIIIGIILTLWKDKFTIKK